MNNYIDAKSINPYIRHVGKVEGDNSNYHIPWRVTYDFEMIFIVKGELIVHEEKKSYVLKANDLHIMSPLIKHRREIPSGVNIKYYNIHFDFVFDEDNKEFDIYDTYVKPCELGVEECKILDDLAERKNYVIDVSVFEKSTMSRPDILLDYYQNIFEVFSKNTNTINNQFKLKGLFYLVLNELIEQMSTKSQETNEVISCFLNLISESYTTKFDLDAFSLQNGLSPNQFKKLFKTFLKKTPHEYIMQLRINYAKKLLLSEKYTITEIAYMINCENVYYFSRLFKRKVGTSPLLYIKHNKNKNDTL